MNTYTEHRVSDDVSALTTYLPVPGLGVLPVASFVIKGSEPILIDTGVAADRAGFLDALHRCIDPGDLRWIWVTHTDPDHVGNLAAVLELAPRARVITNFLGLGKLGLLGLSQDRGWLVNPGQAVQVGDRLLRALRPPVYDAPETMALFDERTRVFFAADCFGGVLTTPAKWAEDVAPAELEGGVVTWAGIDAPWLGVVDKARFASSCGQLRTLQPALVLSSHLPPARRVETLIQHLQAACNAPTFVGPDQAQLEALQQAA
jgi:glyoxylase-like metal-dependent hydrolase (beta-lactamase superfamily II)